MKVEQLHQSLPGKAANDWATELKEDGYCIIPGIAPEGAIAQIWSDLSDRFAKTPFCEGDFYGQRTKRFGGVLKRSATSASLVMNSLVVEIVEQLLSPYCDRIQLNLTQALEIHPGQVAQPLHRDEDMWGGSKGEMEYLVNVMWPFNDYTADNGATRIVPNSHAGRSPRIGAEAIAAEMAPGSALLFLGSTLHGGGANVTCEARAGLLVSYSLGWLKPYENQWLTYPPQIARRFSKELSGLVGYRQHRPNLGNYDGRCPSILLEPERPDYLGAIDELRPDQLQALNALRQTQLTELARKGRQTCA